MEYRLCPSILSADFNRLGEQIKILEKEGVEYLHIDVMDGDFVPSISFGMPVIKSIRKESTCFRRTFDGNRTGKIYPRFCRMRSRFHYCHMRRHVRIWSVHWSRSGQQGVKAAVSIKPSTPVNDISHLLEDVDMVLIMTVQPGFGGQKYMDECTEKIQELRELIDEEELDVDIQVDGGINDDTLETVMRAGANLMVAGSWVFKGDVAANVRHITEKIHNIKKELD